MEARTDAEIEAEVNRRVAERDRERHLSQAQGYIRAAIENLYSARNLYRLHKFPQKVSALEGFANQLHSLNREEPR